MIFPNKQTLTQAASWVLWSEIDHARTDQILTPPCGSVAAIRHFRLRIRGPTCASQDATLWAAARHCASHPAHAAAAAAASEEHNSEQHQPDDSHRDRNNIPSDRHQVINALGRKDVFRFAVVQQKIEQVCVATDAKRGTI
jgi:hypothetical protein